MGKLSYIQIRVQRAENENSFHAFHTQSFPSLKPSYITCY